METRSQPEFKLTVPKKWRLLLAAAAHGSSSELRLTQEMLNRAVKPDQVLSAVATEKTG